MSTWGGVGRRCNVHTSGRHNGLSGELINKNHLLCMENLDLVNIPLCTRDIPYMSHGVLC